jgi:hypothetical protein
MSITNIEIIKDTTGKPSMLRIRNNGKITTVEYDGSNLKIKGEPTSMIRDLIQTIFPFQEIPILNIKEPLQVQNISSTSVLLYDDMESLFKWIGGTKDNTYAFSGSNSLQQTLGAGSSMSSYRTFSLSPTKKAELSYWFSIDNWTNLMNTGFYTQLFHDDGKNAYSAIIGLDRTNNGIYAGGNYNLPALPATKLLVGGPWFQVKAQIDFINKKFISLEYAGYKFPVKDQPITIDSTTGTLKTSLSFNLATNPGGAVNAWYDEILVKEIT